MKTFSSLGSKLTLFSLVIALAAFTACKKTAAPKPTPTPIPIPTTAPVVQMDTDVYIGGTYLAANGNRVVAYVKNGVLTKLSDSASRAIAKDIAVDGPDVYVLGSYLSPAKTAFWKNDHQGETPLRVPDTCTSISATGIATYNHMVYVSGGITSTKLFPVYWSGTDLPIQLALTNNAQAKAIAADATGVYTAGFAPLKTGLGRVSTYWINNGLPHRSKDSLLAEGNFATAITLTGTDVYMAGISTITGHSTATYWKNGIPVYLTDGTIYTYAERIVVKDNVVYTAGERLETDNHRIAGYWKNDKRVDLSDDTQDISVTGIAVVGNDVYISGFNNLDNTAMYWKNGVRHVLPGLTATAGIVVLTHPH